MSIQAFGGYLRLGTNLITFRRKSWSACHLHFVAKIEYMKKALTLKHGSCIFDGEELDQVDHKRAG